MPEGDAVRRTALRLDRALAGQELVVGQLRVPRFATVDLAGGLVTGTEVMGKHLLTRLRRRDRELTLHSHLRMDGRWVVAGAGDRPAAGPAHQIRAWLASTEQQAVGLRLAMVEVVPTSQEDRLVGHLGPDILAAGFDVVDGAARLMADPDRPLAEVLLDQKVICGMGTIWASEFAFAARVSPRAGVGAAADLMDPLRHVREAMAASVSGSRLENRRRLRVYGRDRQPCSRCGGAIRILRVGEPPSDRTVYWCPTCQAGSD